MDDAARGRHPLDIAGTQVPAIAHVVLVAHMPVEHVGHRLESAMRVRRKSREVIVGIVRIKLIEHEERIDVQAALAAEAAAQLHARTVRSGHRLDDVYQGASAH
jgi:hypothetical protein